MAASATSPTNPAAPSTISTKRKAPQADDKGNFWNTQRWRIGPRFAAAVTRAVRAGRLPYREAYALTGLSGDTFANMPEKMGVRL